MVVIDIILNLNEGMVCLSCFWSFLYSTQWRQYGLLHGNDPTHTYTHTHTKRSVQTLEYDVIVCPIFQAFCRGDWCSSERLSGCVWTICCNCVFLFDIVLQLDLDHTALIIMNDDVDRKWRKKTGAFQLRLRNSWYSGKKQTIWYGGFYCITEDGLSLGL